MNLFLSLQEKCNHTLLFYYGIRNIGVCKHFLLPLLAMRKMLTSITVTIYVKRILRLKQWRRTSVVNDSDKSKNGFYSYTGSGWQFQSAFSFQIENSFGVDINNDSELNALLDGLHSGENLDKAGYFRGDYEGSPFMVESIPINYTEDTWVQSVRGRFVPVYQGTVDKIKTLTRSNTEYNILWRVCEKGTWGTWNSMTDAPTISDTDLSIGLKDGDETSGYMQMFTRKGGCYSVTGSRTGVVTGTMMVFCDSWGEHGIEQVLFTDASDIEGKIVHDISSSGHVDGEPRIYHRYYDIRQSGGKWGVEVVHYGWRYDSASLCGF